MSQDCCQDAACEIARLRERQRTTLLIVLLINASMFLLEAGAGLVSDSTALLADSLDMLGDALVYGFSLFVVARSVGWKALAALSKGLVMAAFGLFVFGRAVFRLWHPVVPDAAIIGAIGALALLANLCCVLLLWRHRADDVNMRSVWLCSRNDIIANGAVLLAAAAVAASGSQWPDLVVGIGIAVLFLRSALHVIADARATYAAQPRL
ncbi:MAG: cation transporter [Gammaproteobacteria bacterium]|nr:cation transporter [Gammaproteobacteria bacterium]